jgi:hypothetical protein
LAKKRTIFLEMTPLGYRVRLTRDRWREIIRFKHPALADREGEVRDCVRDPDLIRRSLKDANVHLCYRSSARGHVCVVTGGDDLKERIVITADFTKNLKKGTDLWTK